MSPQAPWLLLIPLTHLPPSASFRRPSVSILTESPHAA